MPKFSKASVMQLDTCCDELREIAYSLIHDVDFGVVCGYRNKADQNKAVADGNSTTPYPKSKHNVMPSDAFDLYPWVNGKRSDDPRTCRYFAGMLVERARQLGHSLRWGGDWDGDMDPTDQSFNDLVHFEIVRK